ncbi:MAG: type II secretion system F family protein [Elusimicrobia bacterium]|nr:type II secretion system F family protein [Elusimicrobiota bacterium]
MAKFNYTVQDAQGVTSTGGLDAPDEDHAVLSLQNKGYFILTIQSDKSASGTGLNKRLSGIFGGRVGGRNLVFFAEQLATLLNGGVPLVRALSLLGEHNENPTLSYVISQINKEVAAGGGLFKAFEKHPNIFPPVWIALVQAGEISGQLPRVLKQLASYIGLEEELKGKILTALMYPAVLFFASIGVLAFFIIKIVPVFAEVFSSFNVKLPFLTQVIITFSTTIAHHFLFLLVAGTGIVLGIKGWLATDVGRYTWNRLQLKIPFFGNFVRNIQMERMLTTLSTLIQSGVSILNAISVLEGVYSRNLLIGKALKTAKTDVASGKSISASFKNTRVFPPLVTEMMWMGEESGKLPDIMGTLSVFYREQIDQFIRRFTAVIDPILVVCIGGVIGVIVLSVFLPIFQLSQIGAGGGGR